MAERAKELKASADKAEGEGAVLAKIAEMGEPDRSMAKRRLRVGARMKP